MQFLLEENMFTIKTISLASQIRTHRPSDCICFMRDFHIILQTDHNTAGLTTRFQN